MILFVNAAENKSLVWEPGMVAWTAKINVKSEKGCQLFAVLKFWDIVL